MVENQHRKLPHTRHCVGVACPVCGVVVVYGVGCVGCVGWCVVCGVWCVVCVLCVVRDEMWCGVWCVVVNIPLLHPLKQHTPPCVTPVTMQHPPNIYPFDTTHLLLYPLLQCDTPHTHTQPQYTHLLECPCLVSIPVCSTHNLYNNTMFLPLCCFIIHQLPCDLVSAVIQHL